VIEFTAGDIEFGRNEQLGLAFVPYRVALKKTGTE
jgi:hypothetical protein